VPIVGDRSIEPDETLTVTLSNPGANLHLGTTTASTVVLDDDSLVSISANAVQVLEGDTGTQTQVSFTVSRADGSAASSVDWSVSGPLQPTSAAPCRPAPSTSPSARPAASSPWPLPVTASSNPTPCSPPPCPTPRATCAWATPWRPPTSSTTTWASA
jgi:hypothetical protein